MTQEVEIIEFDFDFTEIDELESNTEIDLSDYVFDFDVDDIIEFEL